MQGAFRQYLDGYSEQILEILLYRNDIKNTRSGAYGDQEIKVVVWACVGFLARVLERIDPGMGHWKPDDATR